MQSKMFEHLKNTIETMIDQIETCLTKEHIEKWSMSSEQIDEINYLETELDLLIDTLEDVEERAKFLESQSMAL